MVRRIKQSIERKPTEGILCASAPTCEPTSLGFLFIDNYKRKRELRKWQGYVYIIQIDDFIKIGATKYPLNRFTALRIIKPKIFKVLLCLLCEYHETVEGEILYHYQKYAVKGREWFQMPEIELKVLKVLIKHLILRNINEI